jgi:hypothetical protein
MILRLLLALVLVLVCAQGAWSESNARLHVDAAAAIVQIEPLAVGRKLIRLPALEFELSIDAACALDSDAESLSISVADTRKTISGDGTANISGQPIRFLVPARQVSPIAVYGFCPHAGESSELLIRDAVTTHLSLRCSGADGESITYASYGLDVLLRCATPVSSQGDPESEIAR